MKDRAFLIIVGKRIRAERKRQGISQEKLAEIADLHRTYIGMVERGERSISTYNLAKIRQALNVPIEHIFPQDFDILK